MTGKRRRSSRKRMESRFKDTRSGPTVVYDQQMPPHAYACNRAARRSFRKSGIDHTAIPMTQLSRTGTKKDPIYFMGEERFIPPYLWNRVKRKTDKKGKAA